MDEPGTGWSFIRLAAKLYTCKEAHWLWFALVAKRSDFGKFFKKFAFSIKIVYAKEALLEIFLSDFPLKLIIFAHPPLLFLRDARHRVGNEIDGTPAIPRCSFVRKKAVEYVETNLS
jgi:hypothetical protein